MVTPFRKGRVDEEGLSALCEAQQNAGTAALVVCGRTGEAPTLTTVEHSRIVAIAVKSTRCRLPVIAGCCSPSIASAQALAAAAVAEGASAVLYEPPSYGHPGQDRIAEYVGALALAAGRPVLLHDKPLQAGTAVTNSLVARLFATGHIVGVVDATSDLARPPQLRALCGDGLLQISGEDSTSVAHLAMGGSGCMSVIANVVPRLCVDLYRAWCRSDLNVFTRLRDLLAPLHYAIAAENDPIPVKAALELADLCTTEVRRPMTIATAATIGRLVSLLPPLLACEDAAAGKTTFSVAG